MSEHYAYLAVHPRYVNLGLQLRRPARRRWSALEGAGQNMRKMTVRTADDLADERLVPLLRKAREERLQALGRS